MTFLRSRAPPVPSVGIVMYAVGVGKAVEEELHQIASEPAELHVSYSPDFSTMTHLLENLKGSICPGEHVWLGPFPFSLCLTSDISPYCSPASPPRVIARAWASLDRALLLQVWPGTSGRALTGELVRTAAFPALSRPKELDFALEPNAFVCMSKFKKH